MSGVCFPVRLWLARNLQRNQFLTSPKLNVLNVRRTFWLVIQRYRHRSWHGEHPGVRQGPGNCLARALGGGGAGRDRQSGGGGGRSQAHARANGGKRRGGAAVEGWRDSGFRRDR